MHLWLHPLASRGTSSFSLQFAAGTSPHTFAPGPAQLVFSILGISPTIPNMTVKSKLGISGLMKAIVGFVIFLLFLSQISPCPCLLFALAFSC